MIIQSSEVNMKAESSSSYDIDIESKSSFETTLLSTENLMQKVNKSNITAIKNPEEPQFFAVKNYEDELTGIKQVPKFIVELILEGFLEIKGIKLYPYKNKDDSSSLEEKELVQRVFKTERSFEYSKKDSVNIEAKGIIKTQNKNIEIDLNISYSKEFYEKHKESIEFKDISFLDPLVINYAGNENALDNLSNEMTFMFDLNNDGIKEEVPLLKSGNAFLAIDKNHNGKIDNGSELLGVQNNLGFEELREYNEDENSWIDENDEVFKDLLIWTKDEQGEDKLIGLGQSGIGALYLSDISSKLTYNTSVNNSIAQLKSSSIYIKKDGTAGLLSSLDFIVKK